jgi:hypothetical protein
MEIKEIKNMLIKGKHVTLHKYHLLNIDGFNDIVNLSLENGDIVFELPYMEDEKGYAICTEEELSRLLTNLRIPKIDISLLRLKIIDTKKWGKKLIYEEGADSVYFNCYYKVFHNTTILVFYNTSGTRGIENIYIHGIWKIST